MIFGWLKTLFNKLFRIFKGFIAVAFPIAKQLVMAQLKEFAVSAVSKLETTNLSDSERRNQAFQEIQKEASRLSIQIGTSLIYALIEIALQYIKEKNK